CQSGICLAGACEKCTADKNCESGKCTKGICEVLVWEDPVEGASEEEEGEIDLEDIPKNWVGLHTGVDLALVGGEDICSRKNLQQNGYACFYENTVTQYVHDPIAKYGGVVDSTLAAGTLRFLLSYDRLVTPNITLGVRAGIGSGGSPKTVSGQAFSPLHAEARFGYWLGVNPFGKLGFRPYVHLEAGLAAVHVKSLVTVWDCWGGANSAYLPKPEGYDACVAGTNNTIAQKTQVDAYKRTGRFFVGGGAGFAFAFTPTIAAQLNVNLMVMLPNSGFAIEPTVGPVMGF
ncbi:hypothetical protein ACFL5O_05455, partial [Myxococcota bacterium]